MQRKDLAATDHRRIEIDAFRKEKIFQHLSEQQVAEIVDALEKLSLIIVDIYKKECGDGMKEYSITPD